MLLQHPLQHHVEIPWDCWVLTRVTPAASRGNQLWYHMEANNETEVNSKTSLLANTQAVCGSFNNTCMAGACRGTNFGARYDKLLRVQAPMSATTTDRVCCSRCCTVTANTSCHKRTVRYYRTNQTCCLGSRLGLVSAQSSTVRSVLLVLLVVCQSRALRQEAALPKDITR